jgi:hypothetical protein
MELGMLINFGTILTYKRIIQLIRKISSIMKGIIILWRIWNSIAPFTLAMSKQMMPVYDKTMIYIHYPLMMAGIHEILIISTLICLISKKNCWAMEQLGVLSVMQSRLFLMDWHKLLSLGKILLAMIVLHWF